MTADDPAADGPTTAVEIPERIARKIADRLPATEFESVDAYVAVALEQLLLELDRMDERGREDTSTTGSNGDRETDDGLEDRLESLGYL